MTVHGFGPVEDVNELYREKLTSSGLTVQDGEALGFSTLTAEETFTAGYWPGRHLPALKIPYRNPFTGGPLSAYPEWPQFFRVRCLRMPVPEPPKSKFGKYTQPARSGVCAYFPSLTTINWARVLADDAEDIYLTEGELKAAKACREGFPTIGLGGVFNFRSNHAGASLLPELARVNWVRRRTFLIYDSDLMNNPNVAKAAWRLATELCERGALPHLVVIPASDKETKAGLDDYLISDGTSGLDYLIANARPLTPTAALFEFNERYAALTEGTREVVDLQTGMKLKDDQLVYRTTKNVDERRLNPDGSVQHETTNAAKVWLTWPLRVEVRRLLYRPALEPRALIENDYGGHDFNTWQGFAVTPREGNVDLFLQLINHLFHGAPPTELNWFLDWLAYPLRHPGTKLLSAVILHGLVQGSGKTLIGETMKRIYGPAYTKIGQRELKESFNEWAASKSFILGDDITGLNRHEIHDAVKVLVTQTTVRINPKNLTAYELDDFTNWLFTSNRSDAFYLDKGDRRFFVWEVPENVGKLDRQFYRDYVAWLDGDGAAALLYWFQHRDLDNFDPGDAAPETAAKHKMREEARSNLVNWVEDLHTCPDDLLMIGDSRMLGDLFSVKQLKEAFASQVGIKDDDLKLSQQMAGALTAAGFKQVHKRNPVPRKGHPSERFYAIKNADRWLTAPLGVLQEHIALGLPKESKY